MSNETEKPTFGCDYEIYVHDVGGKEPDGKPSRIGKWTFSTKVVRQVVLEHLEGRVLNACAGKTRLNSTFKTDEIVRNDLNPEIEADYHHDVRKIDEHFDESSFDTVVLDPPFSPDRGDALYEGFHASGYIDARSACGNLIRDCGRLVELGWNSYGLSNKDGWSRVEHHLYRQPFKGDVHLIIDKKEK
jgi:hypothetical protein